MVGLSWAMNDSKVDAPIRSPAAAKTVLGLPSRSWSTAPAITAAPPSAPVGVAVDPAVEVVGGENLDVDRGGGMCG